MKLTRLAATVVMAALTTPFLAACSDDRAGDALTIDDGDAASSGDAEPTDDQDADDPFDRAGRVLSAAEIRAALPTVKDLPTGWSRDTEADDDEEDDEEISPPRCEDIFGDNTEAKATIDEERAFEADEWGPFLSAEIGTYEDEIPDDILDEVADALSTCKKFTSTDADGARTTFRAEALSFPNLGEETLAVRMKVETEIIPAAIDLVMVRIGHNLILLTNTSLGAQGLDSELLEKVGRQTVERLGS